MNTMLSFVKGTIQLVIILWVVKLITMIFLRRTLLGRLIAVILKDTWLFLKLTSKVSRKTLKTMYVTSKRINKYLNQQLKTKSKKVNNKEKEVKQQVVNSSNVIDFSSAKQLKHKWNK